jgi:hypothetical protein
MGKRFTGNRKREGGGRERERRKGGREARERGGRGRKASSLSPQEEGGREGGGQGHARVCHTLVYPFVAFEISSPTRKCLGQFLFMSLRYL